MREQQPSQASKPELNERKERGAVEGVSKKKCVCLCDRRKQPRERQTDRQAKFQPGGRAVCACVCVYAACTCVVIWQREPERVTD